jgi:hypothetical protein
MSTDPGKFENVGLGTMTSSVGRRQTVDVQGTEYDRRANLQRLSLLAVIICVIVCADLFEERLGCDFTEKHDTDAIARARKVVSNEA